MAKLTWSSLPSGMPTFSVLRRDDTVVRTLQGSQVAVYEYRTAYDNLLAAAKLERENWARDKSELEDELRSITIRNAETERRLKALLSKLRKGLLASEEALSKLDAEHQLLQQSSEETTNSLLQRVDDLQREVAELQAESRALQAELAAVQGDAAMKDAAMQQAAQLETAMAALQDRARHMISHLERDKASAERRVGELETTLSAAQQQLLREAQARATSDSAALRLATERQQLMSALELERLINEPLRHTHYATTTTLAHMMRSPVAPTVRDRSGRDLLLHATASPSSSGQYIVPRDLAALAGSPGLPGSAPPGPAVLTSIASTSFASSSRAASVPARDLSGSFTFSPVAAGSPAGPRLSPGTLTGRNLTRLGRSWATTTATAGLPNPYFLDNLHSPISPPPPGPPRRPNLAAAAANVTAPPASTLGSFFHSSPTAKAGAAGSGGGGGGGWTHGEVYAPAAAISYGAATALVPTASAADLSFTPGFGPGFGPGGGLGGPSSSGEGQYITDLLPRSPETPGGFSGGVGASEWKPGAGSGGPAGGGSVALEEVTIKPWGPGGGVSGFGDVAVPSGVPLVGAAGGMTGRQAMRASMKRGVGSGGGASEAAGATPTTLVYG